MLRKKISILNLGIEGETTNINIRSCINKMVVVKSLAKMVISYQHNQKIELEKNRILKKKVIKM